jgi:putative peptidoglycan lipid II flippase
MNLLKTVAAISSLTMLSRITGLLRESIVASAFGISGFTDAFNVAFRLPNLLRRIFAEGAFSQAFVPILSEYKSKEGDQATRALVDHVATFLVWSTLLVSALGIIGAPFLIYVTATKMADDPPAHQAAILMTRMMFPYITCMSFVALASGILNTWREFKVPAFTPVLLNLSFIGAALFLSPHLEQPIYAMAIGVMLGGLLQVAFQLPALARIGMLPRIGFNPLSGMRDPGVRRMLGKMGPAVFAVSATQVSLIINTNYATWIGTGAVSALTYADRLMEFPIALLGVALSTVLLPSLSKSSVEGNTAEYNALLNWGLRLTFLLALPAAVGLAVLALPMVATLFHYNKFDAAAVHATTLPLVAYAVGLIGMILVKILAPAFFAKQDTRTPVKIAFGVVIAVQLMNLVFVPTLRVAGLALSIGLGACINAVFLYWGLRSRKLFEPQAGWLAFFAKLLVGLALMGGLTWFLSQQLDWIALQKTPFLRAFYLFGIIGVAAAAYFAVLGLLGFRPHHFKRSALG